MRPLPVPMSQRQSRLPVAGRIRSGIKTTASNGKIKPKALTTFRFTARTSDDLEILAAIYGGTVQPWREPKTEDRFELRSEASCIGVILPPQPLGDGPTYELWGGKGLERSCDGVTCEFKSSGPDGVSWEERPCLCWERQRAECRPKLRLSVILPELALRGVWRYDTGSDLAMDEITAMVDFIAQAQAMGLPSAELRLERRQSQGGSHQFVVPVLGVPATLRDLMEGATGAGTLPGPAPAIGVGEGTGPASPALPAPVVIDVPSTVEPSAQEKARELRLARARAALEGREPPQHWEDI